MVAPDGRLHAHSNGPTIGSCPVRLGPKAPILIPSPVRARMSATGAYPDLRLVSGADPSSQTLRPLKVPRLPVVEPSRFGQI